MTRLSISTRTFRLVFVGAVLLASLQTLVEAVGLTGSPMHGFAAALASVEIGAALLFAVRRFRPAAALTLVLIFAVAFLGSAAAGDFAPRFILYAAVALYLASADDDRLWAGSQTGEP